MAQFSKFAHGMVAGAFLAKIANPKPDTLTHSVQLHYDVKVSPEACVRRIKTILKSRNIPMHVKDLPPSKFGGVKIVNGPQPRQYIKVRFGRYSYVICAANYGNTFFFSYWLKESYDIVSRIVRAIPFVGNFLFNLLNPVSYYRADNYAVFLRVVTDAIELTAQDLKNAYGVRGDGSPNKAVHKAISEQPPVK